MFVPISPMMKSKDIEEANKKEFRSKNRVNRLMIWRVEEVRKET